MAEVGHQWRSRLREGRGARVAARLVWRQRLLPLARIQGLQNARARPALALPLLHSLPGLRGQTLATRSAALPGRGPRKRPFATDRDRGFRSIASRSRERGHAARDSVVRFLPTPPARRLALHRANRVGAPKQALGSNRPRAPGSSFAARVPG